MVVAKFGSVDWWDLIVYRGSYGRSPWRGIMNHLHLFKGGLTYEVGDGMRVRFWEDALCGDRTLK